jgi:hypothetical protein
MKNIIKLFILSFILVSLGSCKLAIYKFYYKAKIIPDYAAQKKIDKFFNKHAVTLTNSVILSDSNLVRKIQEPDWHFDKWELYDSNGYQLRRKGDSLSCIVSDYAFFKDFSLSNALLDTNVNLSEDDIIYPNLLKVHNSEGNLLNQKIDYTLILYWSRWRGRFSENILKLEKTFVLNNPNLRIRILKVNMDFRKEMKGTWVDKNEIIIKEIKER